MTSGSHSVAARRRRVNRIRRRVVGGVAALFVAATGAITLQLVTGHDPALAKATSSGPPRSGAGDGAVSDGSSGSSSGQVAPLTTGQS
jgi:hypothetical protein